MSSKNNSCASTNQIFYERRECATIAEAVEDVNSYFNKRLKAQCIRGVKIRTHKSGCSISWIYTPTGSKESKFYHFDYTLPVLEDEEGGIANDNESNSVPRASRTKTSKSSK